MTEYRFSDEVIAQIAKLVQIAILTGTDIVDNLRTLRVTPDGDETLGLTQEYKKGIESQIEEMLEVHQAVHEEADEALN
jgi:hypothetical protein|tara:strand:- start:479 stop:715 length:237 start_codon:yes stop_codon:yes gene_type:complete